MQHTTFQHASAGTAASLVQRWLPDTPPRAALLIVHGMAEHAARYGRLGTALSDAGFAVYALDLPGHGALAQAAGELGHFGDREGWGQAQAAIARVHAQVEAEQPGKPVFLLGHSMGSMLLEDYAVEHGKRLAGAIFSGGAADMGPVRHLAVLLVRLEAAWRGLRHPSAVAERLSFGEFNRRFQPARTGFDWLSRDLAEVDRYVGDPLCGFRCTTALWLELLRRGPQLRDQQRLSRLPKTLPVLIVNGAEDPVSKGEVGPRQLERLYRAAGLGDVELRIYPGARHELFNETCRDQVTADLRSWLERHS
ncbi:MAG TPA: lysophospholipase [Solimonas sp.]|nr:lysophospholipase [Solimonas sp.]